MDVKKIDGSESSTAKGVNIATEFNKFKDALFNKKIIKYKMKNEIKLIKSTKYLYCALMIKDKY